MGFKDLLSLNDCYQFYRNYLIEGLLLFVFGLIILLELNSISEIFWIF